MSVHLKRLRDQVVVITGATSGIGLVTARMAASRGARLVLVARNEDALSRLVEEIRGGGGEAIHVVADVADEGQMRRVVEEAEARFGGFDTWINNAAVSIYGRIEDVPLEDQRRVFDVNYWGVVIGSRLALLHLRGKGGKIINIGSVLSDRAIPIQGVYSASKHAVKGFTDALRVEIAEESLPVSVTLIKPAAIDTPYMDHARNYLDVQPRNPPPIYAPDLVARAVLHAAEREVRDIVVGGGGMAISALGVLFPRISDWVMARLMDRLQRTDSPARPEIGDNLYEPGEGGSERSGRGGLVRERSLYTTAATRPAGTLGTGTLIAAGILAVALPTLLRSRRAR